MLKHGTPFDAEAALAVGGVVLNAIPRDLPNESALYWKRHGGELQRALREIMLRPGSRVIEIDRTLPPEKVIVGGASRICFEDIRAGSMTEIDLGRVRAISLAKHWDEVYGPNPKYGLLDLHAAMTLLDRYEDLPKKLRNLSFLMFDGTYVATGATASAEGMLLVHAPELSNVDGRQNVFVRQRWIWERTSAPVQSMLNEHSPLSAVIEL